MKHPPERLDRGILMSLALHVLLGVTVLTLPSVFPAYGIAGWGSQEGGGSGIRVEIVSNISGIPLPAPTVVNETAAANDSAGFYESEPSIPEPDAPSDAVTEIPPVEAEPVPETVGRVEPPPSPPPPPRVETADRTPTPENAVPFGEGGRPAINYGQFSIGDGTAGIAVGDGAFGERYGRYVESITRRISENWLQSMIAAQVRTAPRIYVTFDILRDGTIVNERIEESSGIPSLDRSAMRAIFASNPLAPLPPDFRGRSVSVRFWFEYNR